VELADHIEPHREDWAWCWCEELQSLYWHCHSGTKQREEALADRPDVVFTRNTSNKHEITPGGGFAPKPTPAGHQRANDIFSRANFKGGWSEAILSIMI